MTRIPRGCHKFLTLVVCNRCGFKQPHTTEGVKNIRKHVAECQSPP